jgi:hypothetical protein
VATSSKDRSNKIIKIKSNGEAINTFFKNSDFENDSEPIIFVHEVQKLFFGDWNQIRWGE